MNRIGQLKHVTVWLVLLGFLCGMMGPSVSFAKIYREIETEGDPLDGLDSPEGSSGSSGDSGGVPPESSAPFKVIFIPFSNEIGLYWVAPEYFDFLYDNYSEELVVRWRASR
jgi:hypothetical protein